MYGPSIDFAKDRVSSFDYERSIKPDILQKIEYSGTCHGFSYHRFEVAAFCPFSILPDTGKIWIDYSPQKID